jgi:hypothetical protein
MVLTRSSVLRQGRRFWFDKFNHESNPIGDTAFGPALATTYGLFTMAGGTTSGGPTSVPVVTRGSRLNGNVGNGATCNGEPFYGSCAGTDAAGAGKCGNGLFPTGPGTKWVNLRTYEEHKNAGGSQQECMDSIGTCAPANGWCKQTVAVTCAGVTTAGCGDGAGGGSATADACKDLAFTDSATCVAIDSDNDAGTVDCTWTIASDRALCEFGDGTFTLNRHSIHPSSSSHRIPSHPISSSHHQARSRAR